MSKKILRTFVIIGFATSIDAILSIHSANANDDVFNICKAKGLGYCVTAEHPEGVCCTCDPTTHTCTFS